ncbi:MAG TPA: hypothetical protein VMH27_00725 [Puia sp.]|nr:hypothetical protein [Puia sp.]
MYYRTLLTLFLFAAIHAVAQTPVSLSALHPVAIRLRPAEMDSSAFSHFEVLDERADTGRIGIHTCIPDFGRNYDRQLVFSHSAATELAGYLNSRFARAGSPYTALVILRTLWLSDANYVRAEYLRNPERRMERTHIRLKAEVYAFQDGRYIPLLRFDTLQTAMKKRILQERSPYFEWGVNLTELLDNLVDSASALARGKAMANRRVDLDDIREFNASRFNAPIDDNLPARGVYASFEEFRNNTPSIQHFEIKVENHQRVIYIQESGATYYTHDAWGYCDGKDFYIMRDGVLCPAWKEGKAFFSKEFKQPRIYFVDMDTGDIY